MYRNLKGGLDIVASINGIQILKKKEFIMNNSIAYQGSIVADGKKIGFWSQNGGPDKDILQINEKLNIDEINNFIKTEAAEKNEYNVTGLNSLLNELVQVEEYEKRYKDAIRNGRSGVVIVTDGLNIRSFELKERALKLDNDVIIRTLAKSINKAKKTLNPESENIKHRIHIYRNEKDFNIGKSIELEKMFIVQSQTMEQIAR